ncbi:hypothetical protein GCM10007304_12680 [Rhodococcoides trifolii]|uniref:TIGR02680 family protein n=1 Tax=Rhodococcoides trifolii TaxID=908250 RepID=A0A917CYU1_9NOCA|nr:SbcC/MukB-like Walker B domain-containing protein [Rhodococcus trifolii]GGG00217.1 hypothetical protein GCM10007304_12680 [Rhodococcus trifolii]
MTEPLGAKHYDHRWRLTRAGVVNVWHYLDTEFTISGGRLILRGANGSGKSRALEMLLPYLLDGDRRRMDATGSNKVNLDELMRTGARGQNNRLGYLWMELENDRGHLTVGAHVKYSTTANRSEVLFFTTHRRVGHDLRLIADNREALSRDDLTAAVGPGNLSKTPEEHREAVRTKVFGLQGESGKDRFAGLMQLLHTLRSPDVGNRIDEGKLPQILSDALPPLSEQTLGAAGEQLDGLTETRQSQQRLEATLENVERFRSTYSDYAATILHDTAVRVREGVDAVSTARGIEGTHVAIAERLASELGAATALRQDLTDERAELVRALDAFREHDLFKSADDLHQRDVAVAALRNTAEQSLGFARRARIAEVNAADRLIGRYDDVRTAARDAATTLTAVLQDSSSAGLGTDDLPTEIHIVDRVREPEQGTVTDSLDGFPSSIVRPTFTEATTVPADLGPAATAAERAAEAAEHRHQQATRRLQEATRLEVERGRIRELELHAEHARAEADRDDARATDAAEARDELAITTNHAWRQWFSNPTTQSVLPDIAARPEVDAVLSDIEAFAGESVSGPDLDALPARAARSVREQWAVELATLGEYGDRRAEIERDRSTLDAHLDSAPSSTALVAARATASALAEFALTSTRRARDAERDAGRERDSWSAEFENHRLACHGMDLPVSVADLAAVDAACRRVSLSATGFGAACRTTVRRTAAATSAATEFGYATNDRVHAESAAEDRRLQWHDHASKLASAHDALEVPLQELSIELNRTLEQHRVTEDNLNDASRAVNDLQNQLAAARTDVAVAAEKESARAAELIERVTEYNARVRLPGLAPAVTDASIPVVAHPDDTEHIRQIVASALGAVGTHDAVTVNELITALQRFQRDSSGQLDVSERVEDGVYVVHIDGAGDSHHPVEVLDYLNRRVTEGKQALGQRERDVFTGFVLGGVSDELRRRIEQARELIEAMNSSLSTSRTSHGIGVRMGWHLEKDEPELARILELLSAEHSSNSDELVGLLRGRVEQLHAEDPSAGYAAHLATALDYRTWHAVEVTILGPEPDQQRRISKRAKISQGETRFVSYAALFAAADGYLSSLPDADNALRLVLLDDAFAKIDESTIGELMGLLVRLDIDFVMTGHALWGTVPEVPALDIYEIRRLGDSAVITTRVHWDGKHKHLHALG